MTKPKPSITSNVTAKTVRHLVIKVVPPLVFRNHNKQDPIQGMSVGGAQTVVGLRLVEISPPQLHIRAGFVE